MWEHGGWGELGLQEEKGRLEPTLVGGVLAGRPVTQVAAGSSHTVCVSAEGEVFLWGSGYCGRLGLGDEEGRLELTLVGGVLRGRVLILVAGGGDHTD